MSALLDILQRRGVLADDVIARVRSFIRDNNTFSAPPGGDNSVAKTPATKVKAMSFCLVINCYAKVYCESYTFGPHKKERKFCAAGSDADNC